MIQFARSLARQLRAVLRKAGPIGMGRSPRPPLVLQADKDGLRVRANYIEVGVEFRLPGIRPADIITLLAEALDDFEGRKEDVITLENVGPGIVQARWDDGGVPQVRDYTAPVKEDLSLFPEEPKKLFPVDTAILKALDDAAQTAAKEGVRFALQKLQLRGGTGEIVSTDGKQLLVRGGFTFPWKGDILVPATSVFACRELPQDVPVAIGKTDKHLCVRIGPWTFLLAIDAEARFPDAKAVIPAANNNATTCRLTPEDAMFLAKALPRLQGRDGDDAPVTLDLNGHVAVRAKAEGQSRSTEIVLSRSEVFGPAVCFVTNRQYLARAVGLGFRGFRVNKPDDPVVCEVGLKTFVWMPLGKDGALAPSDDALRITSAGDEPATQPPKKERSQEPMAKQPPVNGQSNGQLPQRGTSDNGHVTDEGHAKNGNGLSAPIAEAQSLKEVLHDAYGRAARLVSGLKRQRKQTRLMATTLASLKQLQQIEG